MRFGRGFTCELSTISEPPPISNSLGHLLYFSRLKHLGRRFFPLTTFSIAFCLVTGLGLPLLLMTKETSTNSPSSPTLQSSCESLAQNFQSPIYDQISIKSQRVKSNCPLVTSPASSSCKSSKQVPGGWWGLGAWYFYSHLVQLARWKKPFYLIALLSYRRAVNVSNGIVEPIN